MEVTVELGRRTLGRTGIQISEVGFGSWGIGGRIWRDSDDRASLEALSRAFDLGINFVDTALIYGLGHSERLIAKALRAKNHDVFVATKMAPGNMVWPPRPGIPFREAYPLRHIKKCTEESRRNLNRDLLDLQQFHVWNPEWANDSDFQEAVFWLKQSKKARFVGISTNDHQPGSALSVLPTGLIDCVQVIYNIFDQSPADELFPLCQKLNVGVIARVPFDEGSLAGLVRPDTNFEPNDWRSRYFAGERKVAVWSRIQALGSDLQEDEPLAQTALRFCLSHPAVSTVIPGMRKVTHVEQNVAAVLKGPLPPQTLHILARHRWSRNFYA